MVTKRDQSPTKDRLARYREKRDFSRTGEPAGRRAGDTEPKSSDVSAPRFVVQRHRARQLHYDFRLEIDGVLVSWAVPKGPTLDPGVRRAGFRVEDHPLEYFDFEGVIPAGQYGGGDVIVWDVGTWEAHKAGDPPDLGKALAGGELHLELHGEKLRGHFMLIRTRADSSGREQWLLFHKRDEFAVAGWNPEEHPHSVLTGRTNDEVKADPERLWRSDLPAAQAAVSLKPASVDPPSQVELQELDAMRSSGTWSVFGRKVRVTNLDKVLFPGRSGEEPVTKRELLRYAAQVAPVVLPYLTRRAVILHRFPQGAQAKGFWQHELPTRAPDWLPRWVRSEMDLEAESGASAGEPRTYLVVDEAAALVWAANNGALEWHPWTSQVEQPQQPTHALIDLDPGGVTSWDDLLVLARLHRAAFEHLNITARAKVSGSGGIQIWVPIARGPSFEETHAWVEQLSKTVAAVVPDLVSWSWQGNGRKERGGLARLDYTQDAISKTVSAPYSPCAAPGAPVSAPIDWKELDDPNLSPAGFTIRNVLDRTAQKGDLFREVLLTTQRLPHLQ